MLCDVVLPWLMRFAYVLCVCSPLELLLTQPGAAQALDDQTEAGAIRSLYGSEPVVLHVCGTSEMR